MAQPYFCHDSKSCLLDSSASATRFEASRLDKADRVPCMSCKLTQICGIVLRSKLIMTAQLSSLEILVLVENDMRRSILFPSDFGRRR